MPLRNIPPRSKDESQTKSTCVKLKRCERAKTPTFNAGQVQIATQLITELGIDRAEILIRAIYAGQVDGLLDQVKNEDGVVWEASLDDTGVSLSARSAGGPAKPAKKAARKP